MVSFGVMRGEVGCAQFDHFAGTDEQYVLLGELVENSFGQTYRSRCHRDAVRADFGGGAYFLGYRKRTLKHLM